MANNGNYRLAVLIDADNAQPAIVEGLLAEVEKYGTSSVRRIYGDWTQPNLGLFAIEERPVGDGSHKAVYVKYGKHA